MTDPSPSSSAPPSSPSSKEIKRDAFARHFARWGNKTSAAIHAGYSEHSAAAIWSQLTQEPEVIELVEAYRAKFLAEEEEARKRVGPMYVLKKLKEIADNEEIQASARVSALRLLGDASGMWSKKDDPGAGESPSLKVIVMGQDAKTESQSEQVNVIEFPKKTIIKE